MDFVSSFWKLHNIGLSYMYLKMGSYIMVFIKKTNILTDCLI